MVYWGRALCLGSGVAYSLSYSSWVSGLGSLLSHILNRVIASFFAGSGVKKSDLVDARHGLVSCRHDFLVPPP